MAVSTDCIRREWRFYLIIDSKDFNSILNSLDIDSLNLPDTSSRRMTGVYWYVWNNGHLSATTPGEERP